MQVGGEEAGSQEVAAVLSQVYSLDLSSKVMHNDEQNFLNDLALFVLGFFSAAYNESSAVH